MSDIGQAIGTAAGAVIGFVIGGPAGAVRGAALGYSLTASSPSTPDTSPTYGFDTNYNTKSQDLPVPIIYGKNKIAGNTIFEDISGADDENIALQVAVSEGPIESISDIKANEIDIDSDSTTKLGTRTQSAHSVNTEGQTFPYTAYITAELEASEEISGNPTITSIVEGRKVEVWDGSDWVTKYSQNPAYCLLDFLKNNRYGLGISEDNIDSDSFETVGDYCDETVDGEARFQLDYVLDSKRSSLDYIQDILATFRSFLIYSQGELRLKVDAPDTAVQSFDMDNIVKDSFSYWKTSKNERYNQVTVEYTDPDENWAKIGARASIDSKIQTDGLIDKTIPLLGINRFSQAGRMAKYFSKLSLYCPTFAEWGAGIDSIQCEVGDVVTLSHDVPGWTDKKFRILEMRENENDEMIITGREYNEAVYNDDGVVQQVKKDSNLPNPFERPASVENLSLVEHSNVLKDGTWVPGIKVTYDRPDHVVWRAANIYISDDDGATWDYIARATDEEYIIKEIPPDTYKVRVVSESKQGRKEDFGEANTGQITVSGKDAPPSNVNWGDCTFKSQIVLRWQPITDVDLKAYEVRTDTNFGNDDSALIYRGDGLSATIDNPTQRTYTFYIKALDHSGNYSDNYSEKEVNNPAPSAPQLSSDDITEFAHALWINIPEVDDEDVQGYKLYVTESDGSGDPLPDAETEVIPIATAQKITYQAEPEKYFLIEVSAYDSLTAIMDDENISSAYEAQTLNTQIPDEYIGQSKLYDDLSTKIDYSSEQAGDNTKYTLSTTNCDDEDISDTPADEINFPCNTTGSQLNLVSNQFTVKIQSHANGEDIVSGFGLMNDLSGGFSEFAVLADRFIVYGDPTDADEEGQPVFALDTETNELYLLGDLIADGAITARMLSSAELITDSAQIRDAIITNAKINDLNADKIISGILKSANERTYFDLNENEIVVEDSDGNYSIMGEDHLAFYKSGSDTPHWYSKRVAYGTAQDGDYIDLQNIGYDIIDDESQADTSESWERPPKVQTAIKSLKSYDPDFDDNSQIYESYAHGISKDGFYITGKSIISDDYSQFDGENTITVNSPEYEGGQTSINWSDSYTSDPTPSQTNKIEFLLTVYNGGVVVDGELIFQGEGTLSATIKTIDSDNNEVTHESRNTEFNDPGYLYGSGYNGETIIIDNLERDTYEVKVEVSIDASHNDGVYLQVNSYLEDFYSYSNTIIDNGEVMWIAVDGGA